MFMKRASRDSKEDETVKQCASLSLSPALWIKRMATWLQVNPKSDLPGIGHTFFFDTLLKL